MYHVLIIIILSLFCIAFYNVCTSTLKKSTHNRILSIYDIINFQARQNEQHQTSYIFVCHSRIAIASLLALISFDSLNHINTQCVWRKLLHFFHNLTSSSIPMLLPLLLLLLLLCCLCHKWWMFDIYTYTRMLHFTFIILFIYSLFWIERMEFQNKWWFPRHINWRL